MDPLQRPVTELSNCWYCDGLVPLEQKNLLLKATYLLPHFHLITNSLVSHTHLFRSYNFVLVEWHTLVDINKYKSYHISTVHLENHCYCSLYSRKMWNRQIMKWISARTTILQQKKRHFAAFFTFQHEESAKTCFRVTSVEVWVPTSTNVQNGHIFAHAKIRVFQTFIL